MVEDIVIVVPSYNNLTIKGRESLQKSIDSIYKAIIHAKTYFKELQLYVSWVDDASTDDTPNIVEKMLEKFPIPTTVTRLGSNSHQGYCRNLGASIYKSKYIMFCDSDDEWFDNHISMCYEAITSKDSHGRDIMAVSTLVHTDPSLGVHPDWIWRISGTIPFNKMIRREAFDLIEGFPVNSFFKKVGSEDQAFMQILDRFFNILSVNVTTVKYNRYPGSFFDKQLKKFRLHPAFASSALEEGYLENLDSHKAINEYIVQHIEYLKRKITYLDLSQSYENFSVKFI